MIPSSSISSDRAGISNHSLYAKYQPSISFTPRKSSSFLRISNVSLDQLFFDNSNLQINIGDKIGFSSPTSFFIFLQRSGYPILKLLTPCS
jgi:hypothetical protein